MDKDLKKLRLKIKEIKNMLPNKWSLKPKSTSSFFFYFPYVCTAVYTRELIEWATVLGDQDLLFWTLRISTVWKNKLNPFFWGAFYAPQTAQHFFSRTKNFILNYFLVYTKMERNVCVLVLELLSDKCKR